MGFSTRFMKLNLVAVSATFALSAWGHESHQTLVSHKVTDDFAISVAPKDWKNPNEFGKKSILRSYSGLVSGSREDCEKNLAKVVCETDATSDEIASGWSEINCNGNAQTYISDLMQIYDELPEKLRPSLCSLSRIFLSDNIQSIAFASAIVGHGGGGPIGGYVGFRKSTFLNQPTSHDLISWKEQLAFGGSKQFLANNPKLVQIFYDFKLNTLKQDGLFYVVIHELGHLIDFNNNINGDCYLCPQTVQGWADLSWRSKDRPLEAAKFWMQGQFCYYDCDHYFAPTEAFDIYKSLQTSGFITTYSGVDSYEDFAETWSWYLMLKFKNPAYKITIPGTDASSGDLDMIASMKANPLIERKLQFIDQLWNSPSLKVRAGR